MLTAPIPTSLKTPSSKGATIFKKVIEEKDSVVVDHQPVTIDIETVKQSTQSNAVNNPISQILSQSSHPGTLIAHFIFRTAAITFYLFSSLLSFWIPATNSFVFVFVMVAIFLAIDFWVVKNVTGRRLVGRRWWTRVNLEGKSEWHFEGHSDEQFKPNPIDYKMFWLALYAFPIIWILMGLIALFTFSFSWMVVDGLALVLCFTNLVGYVKCDRYIKRKTTLDTDVGQLTSSWTSSILVTLISNKISSLIK